MLPWSVMPIAGWPSAAAAATTLADPGRAVEHRVLGVHVEVGERLPATERPTLHARPQPVDELHRCEFRPGGPHGCSAKDRRTGTSPGRSVLLLRRGRRAPEPGLWPGGSCRRICSSCWRAAICWANSVAWMPWNRPSSQPTSWAWAMRSSASVGVSSSNGGASRASSSRRSGDSDSASSSIDVS